MKYSLVVTSFSNTRAKMVIARQLAHDPSIPLQKALLIVEKPPFVLLKNLTSQELKYQSEQLNRIGVNFKITELEPDIPENIQPIPIPLSDCDFNIKPPQSVPLVSKYAKTEKKIAELLQNDAPVLHKKNNHLIISATTAIIVFALIIAGLFASGKQRRYAIKRTEKLLVTRGDSEESNKKSGNGNNRKKRDNDRDKVSAKAKKESLVWADSARIYDKDHLIAINFYKIALSFNKFNIHAWFGLLNTYRNAEMHNETEQTRDEMKKLFGESIFTVSETVKPFGEIIDSYTTNNNVFRLEYRTAQTGQQHILSETYKLSKAIREICNCESISIFASTAPGKGMIVHLNSSASLLTMNSFKSEASINFLQ